MNKKNKNIIIFSPKKSNKNVLFGNLSPKMSDPAFQINNTLKYYVDKKLFENSNKELFKNKTKKLKSFHGIEKRNNRVNNYTTTSILKDNIQLISSLQNLSISIINSNNKNNINDNDKFFKNTNYKNKENTNRIFSYTKINSNQKIYNIKENINKTNSKIKYTLSGKIPRIKAKNIFKDYNHSSSLKNIKIKITENNVNKTNIKEKKNNKEVNYPKTIYRFNSSDFKEIKDKNMYSERCIYIRDNMEKNHLGLSQRLSYNSLNKIKSNENKNNKIIKNKNNKNVKNNKNNKNHIEKQKKNKEYNN